MSNTIQTLWIGNKLSSMERLSLASFVHHGHDVHLYTYGDVEDVPDGVEIKDGNDILPESMIFEYKNHKSVSGFSNYFRYKLITEKGGWWVDTDVVCLKPFDFTDPFVLCSEEVLPLNQGNTHVGSCLIKGPANNILSKTAYDICMSKKPEDLVWGEIGPRLVKEMVERFNMHTFVKPPQAFCPIPGCLWQLFVDPRAEIEFGKETYAVHLWNEMWRRAQVDKDRSFHKDSYYEQLKSKYL
jgi:hypothetical protein